ncbi:MAG: hypothetical protein VXY77_00665 [Pseudomonadota bacterium]|nr:hypothetical protein [Pseudomonadota bacterium]
MTTSARIQTSTSADVRHQISKNQRVDHHGAKPIETLWSNLADWIGGLWLGLPNNLTMLCQKFKHRCHGSHHDKAQTDYESKPVT